MAVSAKGSEHRCSASRQTKPACQACTCAASKCQADPRECLLQAVASSCIAFRYSRQAFGKDAARAAFTDTKELSCLKENVRWKPCLGKIGDFTSVMAVQPR